MRLDQLKPVPKRSTWTVTRALAHSEALHPPKVTLPRLIWMEEPYGQKPIVEHAGPGGKARLSPRARRKERAAEIRAEIDDAADASGQEPAISPASGGQESQPVYEEVGLNDYDSASDFERIQAQKSDGIGPFRRPTSGSDEDPR